MPRAVLFLLAPCLLAVALVACGDDEAEPTPVATIAAPIATATPPGPSASPTIPRGSLPVLRLERAFPALAFVNMTGLYQAPDGRFFVLEREGRIRVFDSRQDAAQASVFLDITDRVNSSASELGLLGLAFAPDFGQSGVFFVNYTAGPPLRTVVSRFTAPAPRTTADKASEFPILEVGQPFPNHNGGQTSFGPDGYLYIGFGDGGAGRDPMGNGQNKGALLGKLLRIDVSDRGGVSYSIPDDNRFVGQPGVMEEIWALGLRNPWRFSWDSETGALWLADVGQDAREEIDVIVKGGNYGWSIVEGSQCLSGTSCDRTGLILPVFDYANAGNDCSITGGFIYRGQAIAALRGAYVYADFCSGRVWALRYDGSRLTEQGLLLDSDLQISSFAQDAQGEIYVLAYGPQGGIYKLVP